jgi:predicted dehydrogenase
MAGEGPARYAVVGRGWRAEFFLRLAALMPDRFTVTGVVTRTAAAGQEVEARFGVPTYRSPADLLARDRPEFAVTAVPREANPEVVEALVGAGVPVLSETPPAPDAAGLRALWSRVGGSWLVQVAEQYLLVPGYAARLALVRGGVIGTVTSAQVSATHQYHAVSILRGMLGVRFEPATVRAQAFTAPLADPLSRTGWSGDDSEKDATTTIATLDFGGRTGLYDFTDNQWWNPLRASRIVVRGSRGELVDDRVVRLAGPATPVESVLVRRQTGQEFNLEGAGLDHLSLDGAVVYRNPFAGVLLSDEDIAVATLLDRMAAWTRGPGPPPYPLADACQDQLIALAVAESVRSGGPVTTAREPWATAGS